MAYVIYDGKKIQPAPLVSISKTFNRSDDGTVIGSNYNITLTGFIVPNKGSPNSSGTFWTAPGYPSDENIASDSRLAAILAKQKALTNLFSKDNQGKLLEIQPDDGSQAATCNPDFLGIEFVEDIWYSFCRYTITLSAPTIYPFSDSFSDLIESGSEVWNIENNDTPGSISVPFTYRVSHTLSAKGKKHYNPDGSVLRQAWEEAKNWCQAKLGYSSSIVQASGATNIPGDYQALNRSVGESIDIYGGSYSTTETWVLAKDKAVEDFSISVQHNTQDGLTTVSIDGSVQGFNVVDSNMNVTQTKFQSALDYFSGSVYPNIFTRAQTYGGVTLNPIALSDTNGRNVLGGTISYSYEYNNRPTALISGALSESIVITNNDASEKFAAVPVLGRLRGPVLQDLSTSDAKVKSLSVECVLGPSLNPAQLQQSLLFPSGRFQTLIDIVDPINNGATVSYQGQPQQTWEPITGRASLQIEWTYE